MTPASSGRTARQARPVGMWPRACRRPGAGGEIGSFRDPAWWCWSVPWAPSAVLVFTVLGFMIVIRYSEIWPRPCRTDCEERDPDDRLRLRAAAGGSRQVRGHPGGVDDVAARSDDDGGDGVRPPPLGFVDGAAPWPEQHRHHAGDWHGDRHDVHDRSAGGGHTLFVGKHVPEVGRPAAAKGGTGAAGKKSFQWVELLFETRTRGSKPLLEGEVGRGTRVVGGWLVAKMRNPPTSPDLLAHALETALARTATLTTSFCPSRGRIRSAVPPEERGIRLEIDVLYFDWCDGGRADSSSKPGSGWPCPATRPSPHHLSARLLRHLRRRWSMKRDGVVAKVLGDPDHPVSRGALCGKCAIAYNGVLARSRRPPAAAAAPHRPARAKGRFEPVTWETALATIAERLQDIVARAWAGADLAHPLHRHLLHDRRRLPAALLQPARRQRGGARQHLQHGRPCGARLRVRQRGHRLRSAQRARRRLHAALGRQSVRLGAARPQALVQGGARHARSWSTPCATGRPRRPTSICSRSRAAMPRSPSRMLHVIAREGLLDRDVPRRPQHRLGRGRAAAGRLHARLGRAADRRAGAADRGGGAQLWPRALAAVARPGPAAAAHGRQCHARLRAAAGGDRQYRQARRRLLLSQRQRPQGHRRQATSRRRSCAASPSAA